MPGPSGKVSWPPYIMIEHAQLLSDAIVDAAGVITTPGTALTAGNDAFTLINTALAASDPYVNAVAFNPGPDLIILQETMEDFKSLSVDIDSETTWEGFLDVVLGRIDEVIPADTKHDEDVANFTARQKLTLAQAYNRLSIGAQDANATLGTSFPGAQAMIEIENADLIASYDSDRRFQLSSQRASAVVEMIGQMNQVLSLDVQSSSAAVQLENARVQTQVQLKNAQIGIDVGFVTRSRLWDFQIMKEGWSALSGIQGVPGFPEGMTPEQQAVSALGNVANLVLPLVGLIL